MKKIALLVTTFYLFACTGCATMLSGTNEILTVRSNEQDTKFFFNQMEIGNGTSAVTNVSKRDLSGSTLKAEKPGCSFAEVPVMTQFDPLTLLGILWDWGIFSIFLIDWAATGAVTKATVKNYITTPGCNGKLAESVAVGAPPSLATPEPQAAE
jgi:hypothetical protein